MKFTFLLLSSILLSVHVMAQGLTSAEERKISLEDCEILIAYRDTVMPKVWDKVVAKYVIPKNHIADLHKYSQQLADDTWYATTDWHTLSLTVQLVNDLVSDVLGMVAPLKSATVAVATNADKIVKLLNKIKKTTAIVESDEVEKTIATQAAKEIAALSPYMKLPLLLNNFKDNIVKFDDYSNTKQEVNFQMRNFNIAIANYNKKVIPLKDNLDEFNNYKQYVDDYLSKNCSNMPARTVASKSTDVSTSKEIYAKRTGVSLLATYQDKIGQWIAIGPYMTTDGFATEQEAIESLFYTNADLRLVNDKGKYKIYELNLEAEHDARDVREILKKLGAQNVPE